MSAPLFTAADRPKVKSGKASKPRRPWCGPRASRGITLLLAELQEDIYFGMGLSMEGRRDVRACVKWLKRMDAWARERRTKSWR